MKGPFVKPILRHIIGTLIEKVPAIDSACRRRQSRRYQAVVAGGYIYVAPRNISGVFAVAARSHVAERVLLDGEYEPRVTAMLSTITLNAGVIINIGANIGLLTVYLASLFPQHRVIAVEPNPEAVKLLRDNVERNGLTARVDVEACCISSTTGETELTVIDGLPEYSSMCGITHPSVISEPRRTIRVRTAKLCDLIGTAPVGLIFADTEGAEELVFSGAREVLMRDRPLLIFECEDRLLRKFGSSSAKVEELLKAMGYEVMDALDRGKSLKHPFNGEAIAVAKG